MKSFGATPPPMGATPRFRTANVFRAGDRGAAAESGKSKETGRHLAAGQFELSPAVSHSKKTQTDPPPDSYLTSTLAPASSNFFLIAAASSLFTPSLIGLGAPSTRSLASFRPKLVTSRTALMTLILLAPTSVRTTENSVCSSAGMAPGGPPPAMTTGAAAAAETPKVSSIFLTKSAASSSVSPLISSRIDSTFLAIASFSSSLVCELFCFNCLLHGDSQIPIQARKSGGIAPGGRLQQEHDLANQLFLRWQKSQLLNFRYR